MENSLPLTAKHTDAKAFRDATCSKFTPKLRQAMKKQQSAMQKLKKWLESGRAITPLQALEKFKIMRLGARIYDFRKEGMNITTTIERKNGKRFAKYRLA